jgi:predicted nucleic acid-binding protein
VSSDSVQTADCARELKLEALIRSDALRELREFLMNVPAFRPLLETLIQIRLIVDANIIQSELRWRLARRRKPDARSGLHEDIVAGVVVLFAPVFLKSEIEEHMEEIALETDVAVTQAMEEWQRLQVLINFYQPLAFNIPDHEVVDVDDVPYKRAYEELAALAVYSRDPHLPRMNVPVISLSLDLTLRKHARSSSVFVHITLGSTIAATIGFGALKTLFELVRSAGQAFRRLPTAVQVSVAAMGIGLLIHPSSREKITRFFRSLGQGVIELKPILLPVLVDVVSQFLTAAAESAETRKQIESALPSTKKRSAIMHARTVCLMSKEPLSVAEIERRMRFDGYASRSANFAAYLQRLLRTSKQFIEASPGMWSLQQVQI